MKEQKNLAHIAINKSRVKECKNSICDRIVYLNNGTEFQLEFFNPYHYTIGIRFSFDENSTNSHMLVLKPGERVWLDRYLDSPKKFLFSTYEVENSKEAREAISENGFINIQFYREKKTYPNTYPTINIKKDNWWEHDNGWQTLKWYSYTSSNCSDISEFDNKLTCNSNCCQEDDLVLRNWVTSEINDVPIQTSSSTINATHYCDTIETGRIEEGSYSNQSFNNVYNEFYSLPFKTEKIKLLPTSQKPVIKSDLQKKFCYNCGRKIKDKFKFCPNCGAKQ